MGDTHTDTQTHTHTLDLEIDRVKRIDSTRLKIDRLDFSRFCRLTRLG